MYLKCIEILAACILAATGTALAGDYIQLPAVIHIQTRFDGSGAHSIDELVDLARERGIAVLVPTDHDLQVMEYGIFPLRNLIKRREERDSVIRLGPEKYLAQIDRANRKQTDVLVVPGVQSSPFYYWTGSPFTGNLTAHDFRKELLIVGLGHPEDYRNLPLLHRGFSDRYVKALLPRSIIFLACFFLAVFLIAQKGVYRVTGWIVAVISLLLLVNHHPFQSSRFDPYHGDRGMAPFQAVIDYVTQRGGLVFWAHPESNYAVRGVPLGPAMLMTGHYPDALAQSTGYTGFEAIYGDNQTATDPGEHWDRVLTDYCQGRRSSPVWAIAGADFRAAAAMGGGVELDAFQNVLMVRERTGRAVLDALKSGRFYALQKGTQRLSLNGFTVIDAQTRRAVVSGESLQRAGLPVVEGRLSASGDGPVTVDAAIIRNGSVIETLSGRTPLTFRYRDAKPLPGKSFYRVAVKSPRAGTLLSNPIFVVRP